MKKKYWSNKIITIKLCICCIKNILKKMAKTLIFCREAPFIKSNPFKKMNSIVIKPQNNKHKE